MQRTAVEQKIARFELKKQIGIPLISVSVLRFTNTVILSDPESAAADEGESKDLHFGDLHAGAIFQYCSQLLTHHTRIALGIL